MGKAAPSVERYESSGGARVYRLPLEVFPDFWGYAHLVLADGLAALVDVGSGFGDSNEHLEAGLAAVRGAFGEAVDWASLTHVLISHGHIDHFGGLTYVRERAPQAQVGVHELDLRVLTRYEERLMVMARRLRGFLVEAGVDQEERESLLDLYLMGKHLFRSVPVDFTFEAVGMQVGPLRLVHTPGHCPGHVVLRLDDLLLVGDHVLPHISPHQAPERLALNTGLGHYLESLEEVRPLAAQARLALGGHGKPIEDLAGRVTAIERLHLERLARVLDLLESPATVAEVASALFPQARGYNRLLALEEAGAHVEYLEQRGYLSVANPEDLEADGPVPLRYVRAEPAPQAWPPFRIAIEETAARG